MLVRNAVHISQKSIAERCDQDELLKNPIASFIEAYVDVEYDDESISILKEELHSEYMRWCKKHGLPVEQYETSCRILKKKHNFIESHENSGKRRRVWVGIRLKAVTTLTVYLFLSFHF